VIKERYLFLKEYNLEANYFFDPLGAYIFELFIQDKSFYFLSEAIGFVLLFTVFSTILVYTNISGYFRQRAINSIVFGIFLSLLLYILRPDGILQLTLFPLIFFLLGASCSSMVKRSLLYIYSMVLAGPLAFIFLLIALVFQRTTSRKVIAGIFSYICIPVSFLCTLFFSKLSLLFDYPVNAQLVPLSVLSDIGYAFFGPQRLPLSLYAPSFLEDFKKSFLFILFFLLPFIVTCLITFVMKYMFSKGPLENRLRIETVVGTFLSVLLMASIILKDGEFSYAILGILFRGVPGILWRPYPFLFPGIILVVFLLYMLRSFSLRSFYSNSICTLVLFITYALLPFESMMIRPSTHNTTVVYDPERIDFLTLVHHSPSSFFMHVFGDDAETYIEKTATRSELEVSGFKDKGLCHAVSSRNNEEASLALDGNHATRWSTRGPQEKGDWYEIVCEKAVSVSQIHLSIVHFKSDFPRGISVQIEKEGFLHEVFNVSEWYGSHQFTNYGFPYFGPQSDVVIDLPREVESTRFRFTLTRGHELFDWSIAKILFLK
jgi:hypothetical protein